MDKFRIRIETQKNGLKWYRAQECILSIFGFWLSWHNLTEDGYRYTSGSTNFLELKEAEQAIEKRKIKIIKYNKEVITRVEHKYL